MSRAIRWAVAAGLALAASGPAWAADSRPDGKATGGDFWFDEFYSSATPSAPRPTPVVAVRASHGATTITTDQHPDRHTKGVASVHARGHHRRLARSR